MRKRTISLLLAILLAVLTGCSDGNDPKLAEDVPLSPPDFTNVTVHDPSVIKVDQTYYVFGSHLMSAKSDDLVKWTQLSNGVRPDNKLIPDASKELKETFEWAQTNTLWAADVIQLADGKYYMYYNACKGDSPRSAMGLAVSDNVEGPYKNVGVFLKSGMGADEPLADGSLYDATIHPNVVDPDVFFDKDGKLWMVYGSYSGGIFILKMDARTGLPEPGQGYGKRLTGGNHARIEGPYMLYSPETDYYYLFLSFGGLDANGGYNMRVARSRNPDGPFMDPEGQDIIDAKGAPGTIFDDESIEPFGLKLMGGFEWEASEAGEPIGYVSPGHNSAYYDEANKQYFLLFHSRFPDSGEMHQLRVHQLFMDKNGWPIAAPRRYSGEKAEDVNKKNVPGDYMLINHGHEITPDVKRPSKIRLGANGKITGDSEGTWKIKSGYKLEVKLNGESYDGLFIRGWDEGEGRYALTFTLLSDKGIALWGSKI